MKALENCAIRNKNLCMMYAFHLVTKKKRTIPIKRCKTNIFIVKDSKSEQNYLIDVKKYLNFLKTTL